MKTKYTTEIISEKYKRNSIIMFALIFVGLSLLATDDFKGGKFQIIGQLLDNLLFIGIGTFNSIFFYKKHKQLKGHYFEIGESSLSLKQSSEEFLFNAENLPKSITINLKTIVILQTNDKEIELKIDDYEKGFKEKRELKKQFEILKRTLNFNPTPTRV